MKYFAVINTNVLVSAMLKWNFVPGYVPEFVFSGTILPLLNEHIVREYREVLSRPKFHLTDDIIDGAVGEIVRLGIFVDADELEMEFPDPKDCIFYEVVMEGRKNEKTKDKDETVEATIQYKTPVPIAELLEEGYLKKVMMW